MDGSVALGAVLWCVGLLCVAGQLAWNADDKRKAAEEAEREGGEATPVEPHRRNRLPARDRLR